MGINTTAIPKWYGLLAAIALIWNLLGIGTFFQFVFISAEAYAELSMPEQQLHDSYPMWTVMAFGIAVFGGALGSIGLGMRKKWALYGFVISLLAIIPQMTYNLFYSNQREVYGAGSEIMPITVIIVGIFLVVFTTKAYKKGWLR